MVLVGCQSVGVRWVGGGGVDVGWLGVYVGGGECQVSVVVVDVVDGCLVGWWCNIACKYRIHS